jgi:RNA polymerase subunit RPABC4/transcription elongation factor Spt4
VALFIHRLALRKGYGLIALISWHLLVIFFVPLTFKIFEFLQVNVIFQFIFDIISKLLGGLLFLVSYVYILLVPLVGFGIIKFFQKFVFNAKVQVINRVQNSQCIRCAKKIRHQDLYCPYCGYHQATECQNCHTLTYQHLPYCRECGSPQSSNHAV